MILLMINAAIIYAIFTAFSSSASQKRENTTELAVLSVIGTSIIFIGIFPFLGRIPALLGSMIWLIISFHFIGKLPLIKSLVAAVCMFLLNMVIGVLMAKDQIVQ